MEALPKVSSRVRIGACVGRVGNFLAIGTNYADHARETGDPIPDEPIVFNKAPSCIVGPNDNIVLPAKIEEDRLGSRAGPRHRPRRLVYRPQKKR